MAFNIGKTSSSTVWDVEDVEFGVINDSDGDERIASNEFDPCDATMNIQRSQSAILRFCA